VCVCLCVCVCVCDLSEIPSSVEFKEWKQMKYCQRRSLEHSYDINLTHYLGRQIIRKEKERRLGRRGSTFPFLSHSRKQSVMHPRQRSKHYSTYSSTISYSRLFQTASPEVELVTLIFPGLIALAAASIALGSVKIADFLDTIVPSILACCNDHDPKVPPHMFPFTYQGPLLCMRGNVQCRQSS
jgi:hypothetical protein